MSAHAGLFYFDGRPVPPEAIRTLSDACRPYGLDRAGQLCPSPGVAHAGMPTTKIRIDDIPEPNFPASMHVRDVNPSRVSAHERMVSVTT